MAQEIPHNHVEFMFVTSPRQQDSNLELTPSTAGSSSFYSCLVVYKSEFSIEVTFRHGPCMLQDLVCTLNDCCVTKFSVARILVSLLSTVCWPLLALKLQSSVLL